MITTTGTSNQGGIFRSVVLSLSMTMSCRPLFFIKTLYISHSSDQKKRKLHDCYRSLYFKFRSGASGDLGPHTKAKLALYHRSRLLKYYIYRICTNTVIGKAGVYVYVHTVSRGRSGAVEAHTGASPSGPRTCGGVRVPAAYAKRVRRRRREDRVCLPPS